MEIWFQPLVWTDYRLAVLFLVIMPLMLLIWAVIHKSEAIQLLLSIYWRVSSLLMITLYLMIPAWPISFVSSLAARILIPISLWFWVDLNEEISDLPKSSLKILFTSWRWAVTIYSSLGAIASLPFLSCTFSQGTIEKPFCQVWLEPPLLYKQIFHSKPDNEEFLGFVAMLALIAYVVSLSYFVLIRLGKQGRSAMEL